MNHTLGPWKVNDDQVLGGAGLVIWADAGGVVALMPSVRTDAGKPIGNLSNARLIAAAPDLLEACKRLLAECCFVCDKDSCECGENGTGFDDNGDPCEHIQAARAIAKAEKGGA